MSVTRAHEKSGSWKVVNKPRGTLFALIRHVLRLQVRSVIIWSLAFGAFGAMMVSFFPMIESQAQIEALVQSYPPEVMKLFGIEDLTGFGTIEGFLDGEIFGLMAPLALAFFPILASAGAIAGAEERGTIDVLMGNPLPRWQLVVGYFAATAISLLGILAIFGAFLWVPAQLLGVDLSLGSTAEGVFGLWPLGIFFGALSMLLSAIFHRRVLATAISAAVLVGMYFLDTLGSLVEELEDYRAFSVFYQYGFPIKDGIDWAGFASVSGVALVLVVLAVLAFLGVTSTPENDRREAEARIAS